MAINPFDIFNEPIEVRVMAGLAKIGLALKSQAWQDASPQGITPTQGQILALLRSHGESGMRLGEIAKGLAVKPATASEAVAALVEKGLVQKDRAIDDARAVIITLSRKGQQEANLVASWSNFLLEAIEELSLEEREVFLRSLIKIIAKLQREGHISASRMCVTCKNFRSNVYDEVHRPHHCALVNAPFGDGDLRIDCSDYIAADSIVL